MTTPPPCGLCALPSSAWLFDPGPDVGEGARETLHTLSNGYLGVRGSLPESRPDGVHYPGTYVAGVFNRLTSTVDGVDRVDEAMVNLPSWLPFSVRVGDDSPWLAPDSVTWLHHHLVLDLRRGVLLRDSVAEDRQGRRVRLQQERLVSMQRQHLGWLRSRVTPLGWSGTLQVRVGLDGVVVNDNVAEYATLAKDHLRVTGLGQDEATHWLVAETAQSGVRIATAARTSLDGTMARSQSVLESRRVFEVWSVPVRDGVGATVDRAAAVFTSRDPAISDPAGAARAELNRTGDYTAVLDAHVLAWREIWHRARLSVGLDPQKPGRDEREARRLINLNVFHVAQTVSRHTAGVDAGIPVRGLHGEGYRGHVFWDELFVYPLLNLRFPELSRALLLYRHRRLPRARQRALEVGGAGALFPWQSGSDGREETPPALHNPRSGRWMKDNSWRQYHVNLAVARNVWEYYQATDDLDFLDSHGVELMVETARFWAALAQHDEATDRYHLRSVMGPDEFHDGYPDRPGEGIDDNAYVNVMTAWALARTIEACRMTGGCRVSSAAHRLGVTAAELAGWERLTRRLAVPFGSDGLLAQFDGYEDLAELDWPAYRARYGHIGRLDLVLEAEGDSTNRYQATKQADVLMLLYLLSAEELTAVLRRLGYDFDPATIPDTVAYYGARTTHGSTLSRVVHSWVLARGCRPASWRVLRRALEQDADPRRSDVTREGIHLGAMAATSDILQRCYTGLQTRNGVLSFHPALPEEIDGLGFHLRYRGHELQVDLTHELIALQSAPGAAAAVTIGVDGTTYPLATGARLLVRLSGPGVEQRCDAAHPEAV